jgi:uncharacterized protein YukE
MSDVVNRLGTHAATPTRTGKISVDPAWLELYAKRVEAAADELSHARDALRQSPLPPASFGEIGRTLRSAEAYSRAAGLLNQQLDRACEVLASAATGLHTVAGHYGGNEDEAAHLIKKADHR